MRSVICIFLSLSAFAATPRISGERTLWGKVEVTFQGPGLSEAGTPNPFLDYRLEVTFTHKQSGDSVLVRGHYAADGKAAESSSASGSIWRAYFLPAKAGDWSLKASFRNGKDIALTDEPTAGTAVAFDGATASFSVAPSAARGLLQYVNRHYLRFAGSGEYFLKGGADSPENFLAYSGFDGTFDTDATFNEGQNSTKKPFVHEYAPHAKDWRTGDPVWHKTKGKGIIGALNYLASKGMNSVYFLTYNIDTGDGKDIWMWTSPEVRDRFDVSKLDQWEIVFSHMDKLGLMLHVITHETENDCKLGGSCGLNPVRKLYLRELISRFAHHPALVWNLGEENNMPDADRKAIAAFIHSQDPYDHPVTVHTHVNKELTTYEGLYGDPSFEATSIQADMENYYRDSVLLRERSAAKGRPLVIFSDEQPHADTGVLPDEADPSHDIPRIHGLWGQLLGGGAGVEWYFGYKYPHMDLNCEDWRSRDRMWDQTRHALAFFKAYLPFWEMSPLTPAWASLTEPRVFAKPGSIYAMQLPVGGPAKLFLAPGSYSVHWYNPRTGGALLTSNVTAVSGGATAELGVPPSEPQRDWIVLVRRSTK